jgi:hypothetical protein
MTNKEDLTMSALDTPAELLAAAMQLPEVLALVEAAKAQLQYMDLCNDKGDLERNLRATLAPFTKGGE